MMRSRFAAIGVTLYLLTVACAWAYPLFDHRTFSGLFMVLLALPWIDYLPGSWLLGAIAFNALIIYFLLAVLSFLFSLFRPSRT
jgi:hypothetical protein